MIACFARMKNDQKLSELSNTFTLTRIAKENSIKKFVISIFIPLSKKQSERKRKRE